MAAPTFFLWDIRETILEGRLNEEWYDNELAVYPVLLAHENHVTRIASPSYARIAALAGVSKSTVQSTVKRLSDKWLLTINCLPSKSGTVRAEYRMGYTRPLENDSPRKWLHLDAYLVHNGFWADMPPDARRLYLVMQALSWGGGVAGKPPGYGGDWSESHNSTGLDFRFLDESYADPARLRGLAWISPRSFSRSYGYLVDMGFVRPNEEGATMPNGSPIVHESEDYREGLILPSLSGFTIPKVMERVARAKAELAARNPEGKRMIARTSRRLRQRGPDPRLASRIARTDPAELRTEEAVQSDISVPESLLESPLELAFEPPF